MNHQYHLERALQDGKQVVRLLLFTSDYERPPYIPGFTCITNLEVIASAVWEEADIILQIRMDHEKFTISYGSSRENLTELCVADGGRINPEIVGCMVGTMIGIYASGNGTDSENSAEFDWFEIG